MISIRVSKFIKSLQLKKFRQLENKFVVEGAKNVLELLASDLKIHSLFVTEDFQEKHRDVLNDCATSFELAKESDFKKVGTFNSNNAAIAIVEIPENEALDLNFASVLAFDRIKDPGNLGTIIRIADWYGFTDVYCSTDSVDCYNAKVISATMGSFTRVNVHYGDLTELLQKGTTVYGTTLQGDDMHSIDFKSPSVVLFGNESTGISDELKQYLTQEVKIEGYGAAESLNVAVSTAVFCDNYRRILKD